MNNTNFECNSNIASAIDKLINNAIQKRSRTMTVRFDIRYPEDYEGDTSQC